MNPLDSILSVRRAELGLSPAPVISTGNELDRVLALPTRPPQWDDDDSHIQELTAKYRRPGGTWVLLPQQAQVIYEVGQCKGGVGALAVGAGKTLTSLLCALELNIQRAVLMLRPDLMDKLYTLELPVLERQFKLPNVHGYRNQYPDIQCTLYPVAYSTLSSQKQGNILDKLQPQALILDEAHALSGEKSARKKRFLRFMKEHPNTIVVVLTGSLFAKDITECAHLVYAALKDKSPMPVTWNATQAWAQDPPKELGDYRDRLLSTPGFIATRKNPVPVALNIFERPVDIPDSVKALLQEFRETWETPWGDLLWDEIEYYRYSRQLSTGMAYRRIWPPVDKELIAKWLSARKKWNREIRDYLGSTSIKGLDSPGLIELAADRYERWRELYSKKKRQYTWRQIEKRARRKLYDSPSWMAWREIKSLLKPSVEEYWVDDFLVKNAVDWGQEHTGIIWSHYDKLGRKIAEVGGYTFYGAGDEAARAIAVEIGRKTIVASVHAHREGRNLQAFHKNLVLTPSSNPKTWEQLIGRTRRQGQKEDVDVHVCVYTPELMHSLYMAHEGAKHIETTLGNEQQLCKATWTFELKERKRNVYKASPS